MFILNSEGVCLLILIELCDGAVYKDLITSDLKAVQASIAVRCETGVVQELVLIRGTQQSLHTVLHSMCFLLLHCSIGEMAVP